MRRRALVAYVAAAAVLLPSCGFRGLSFVQDERVEIVEPKDRAEVRIPVTVRWTVRDFAVTGPSGSTSPDSGYFGVFVDREPQPPDRTFRWLARNDKQCEVTPGCPDTAYFNSKDVYATQQTSFTIRRVRDLTPQETRQRREFHEAVIVLLNGRGERIGESAFRIEFQLEAGG